jgi:O-antigen/teichoic acid export membrane protein
MSDQAAPYLFNRESQSLFARYKALLVGYLSLLSGSLGRLVFSLVYFLVLANTLPVAAFGVFAAVSAMGVVLSRICGLGFSSPLYRAATVKRHLIGTYLAGYWLFAALSLPLVTLGAFVAYRAIFNGEIAATAFLLILVAEIALWRSAEILIIINNGLGRFSLAAVMTILGTATRMVAALAFAWVAAEKTLEIWAGYYVAANAVALIAIAIMGWPKSRLRLAPKLYLRRMRDALAVAGGEVVFYAQMELDKVLMLAIAGGEAAGIYAIIMRLVDLTAIPIRAFNTLLVQSLMRLPDQLASLKRRFLTEGGIALVSTLALGSVCLLLWLKPNLLGNSIAQVAPALVFALAIPAFRNLTEYHSELLYARGQTFWRVGLLVALGAAKALAMLLLLNDSLQAPALIGSMSLVFVGLYAISATTTYRLMRRTSVRF